ncbi:Cell division protein SepF [bioreactor metagenome]|jgi:cell division inhibitor SepF|uniref:Cell division protein SepF n=2 Tax=bioreactor metagenome TaxID=1076179 RepID=A0A644XP27_9ZZZZ
MASLYTKFLDFIGIEENEEADEERRDDGYYRDDADDRGGNVVNFNNGGGRAPAASHRRSERAASSTGSNLPISGGMKMIVYHPVSYEDTQSIIDNLKNRKPVIVNMEELELDTAQRILDFLSGAVYALNGTMCKISRGIFVVAPNNYDVVGNGEDDYGDLV